MPTMYNGTGRRKNAALVDNERQKKTLLYSSLQLQQMSINFQNALTEKLGSKFAMNSSLKIQPHTNCVATLPYF